jgi:hypothetical protein
MAVGEGGKRADVTRFAGSIFHFDPVAQLRFSLAVGEGGDGDSVALNFLT